MHVKSIAGNVKRGVEAELSPCTFVVGRNASGKSALVAALELALTGRSSEVGAAPAALKELCGNGALRVAATLSDGRRVDFEPGRAPVGVMLRSTVTDLLSHEPKRLREALLSACCGEIAPDSIEAQVPEAFRDEWALLWRRCLAGSTADTLVATVELIRAEIRQAKATVREASPEKPTWAAAPNAEDLAALTDRARELERGLAADEERVQAAATLPEWRRLLRKAEAAAGSQVDYRAVAEAIKLLGHVRDVAAKLRSIQAKTCAVCGRPAPVWDARITDLDARISGYCKTISGAPERLVSVESILAGIKACEEAIDRPPSGATMAELVTIRETLATARQAQAETMQWEALRDAAARAQARLDVLKALESVANRIVADTLGASITDFCARASSIIGRPLSIQLFDRGKPACKIALGAGNGAPPTSWHTLSGAERARFAAGFACALASSQEGLRVVVVDDVWLDHEALTGLCKGLGDAVSAGVIDQAIVCAVTDYGCTVSGWQHVLLDRAS